jgi:L-2-hydroxyglutarate oxidase LhgO
MERVDILIVGAGLVGLAVARELSGAGKEVVVVERNISFGQETSSRNSEVIHGGMYYPAGSLKAKLCVEGRRLIYGLCAQHSIAHRKTGKLIVATDKSEIAALEGLLRQGQVNGVEGLSFIEGIGINRLEPKVRGMAALYSRETGIIDSHRFMEYLLASAKEKGATISYGSEVTGIERDKEGYGVKVRNAGEEVELTASVVVNSAGLDSDNVAGLAGIDVFKEKYDLHYCKGQYFRVSPEKSRLISRLVYPVPKPAAGGLGIHATPDLAGSVRLGPDDSYLAGREKDYSVDEKRKAEFCRSVSRFIPCLEEGDLTADTSGIRPKLQEEGGGFRDFVIRDEADKDLAGFINLIGIESPGLTASLAISALVKDTVGKYL